MTSSKTAVAIGAFAVVTAVFACGTKDEAAPSSATSEAGARDAPPPVGVTVAPDGKGVCCPLESPCSPSYRGGWAPTADECVFVGGYDGIFKRETDDHGCVKWVGAFDRDGADMCCGCVAVPDAASDASNGEGGADASDSG